MNYWVLRSKRVVTPNGIGPASIHIADGKIVAITESHEAPPGAQIHDAGESVIMPGLVDTHVHINDPGRAHWEGFRTATQAAAAGGITTLVEMPLNSIPATTSVNAFREKVAAANGELWADVGFWGGVVPGNASEVRGLYDAGAFGFKCFLVPSGVDEFAHVTESDLRKVLPALAEIRAPLLVHAELPGPIEFASVRAGENSLPRKYSTWLASRPREAEDQAIAMLIRLAEEFGVHIHVVHLSSSNSIAPLSRAKQAGLPITVETCPHYLTFAAEEIPDGATQFKCAPPIRERANRELLWQALAEGVIDLVASDHSPCPPEMKLRETGDFMHAWGGISSLQISLPVMWTQLRQRGFPISKLCEWMCAAPARLAGLDGHKGVLQPGCYADIVIWNPEESFRVDPAHLLHKHRVTPYENHNLYGVVETTFVRGMKVYDRGIISPTSAGVVLKRNQYRGGN
jgi:allantoinase